MREYIITIIYGIVEGITEFLPISSTGHLIIAQHLFDSPRSELFNIGIQSGAVIAVVLVNRQKITDMLLGWRDKESRDYLLKCVAAFVVTAILGLLAKAFGFELTESPWPVAWAVFLGALAIFGAEYYLRHRVPKEKITWPTAILVGAAQVLAGVFPGTSRSAATIIAGMFCGASRMAATEFSFLLGIPTMFAATLFTLVSQVRGAGLPADELGHFIVGFIVSLLVAFAAVKWLLGFLRSNTFTVFAWYRLAVGIGLLAWLTIVAT